MSKTNHSVWKSPLKCLIGKLLHKKSCFYWMDKYGFSKRSLKVKNGKKKNCESLFTFQLSSVDLTSVWRILFDEKVSKFVILWLRDFHSRLVVTPAIFSLKVKLLVGAQCCKSRLLFEWFSNTVQTGLSSSRIVVRRRSGDAPNWYWLQEVEDKMMCIMENE